MRRRSLFVFAVVIGLTGTLIASGFSIGPFNPRAYLAHIPRIPLILCALLVIANEIVKGARWGAFLRASGVRIRMVDAISTSMASQTLTVLPGHDLLAARLVEEHQVGPRRAKMRQALPSLVARWIADAIALSILVTIGMTYYGSFTPYTLLPILVGLLLAVLCRWKTPARWMIQRLARFPKTQKLVRSEADFHRSARRVMHFRPLATGILYSICCTCLSATMLYVLTRGFGSRVLDLPEALVTHALSTLAGQISFVPGGFGVADGSIAGWMHFFGVGTGHIVLATMTLRLVNIVVRTAVGIATLTTRYQSMWEGSPRLLLRRVFSGTPVRHVAVPVVAPAEVA
jgi:uncharacterized protein (TIRG00374 family)